METAKGKREIWVDNTRVIACILVVSGHFFQSMIKSGILSDGSIWQWFDKTIYCFHVPLFFICSGYLYQKRTCVENWKEWKESVLKKALNLGIPYFVFSSVTWVIKAVFSWAVNSEEQGYLKTLFMEPLSPYWYLYILFMCFLFTPTLKKGFTAVFVIAGAVLAKGLVLSGAAAGVPYVLRIFLGNEIWFASGMMLCAISYKRPAAGRRYFFAGLTGSVLFLALSVVAFQTDKIRGWTEFLLGISACVSVVMMTKGWFADNRQNTLWAFAAKYTLPVFLMHTIFAAGLRSVLLKSGIENAAVHLTTGIFISFIGPIAAMKLIEKVDWLNFMVYPEKVLKNVRQRHKLQKGEK